MVDNVLAVENRPQQNGKTEYLVAHVYDGEDHGTVVACSLSRGSATFFKYCPFATED